MERIRKHRAWHKEAQKMLYDSSLNIFKWLDECQPIEIMDYCGLKDKNGKEIYEGDILKLANGETICVDFKAGKFLGIRKNKTHSITSFYWIYSEIIGNIYENKDVLK